MEYYTRVKSADGGKVEWCSCVNIESVYETKETDLLSKKELRKEILARRDALSVEERQEKSARISKQVIEQIGFQNATKVLLFSSFKSEVDAEAIFREAKRHNKDVYYPKVIGKEMEFYQVDTENDLIEGYRGIREPESDPNKKFVPNVEDMIFVLMPGAAFDGEGNRIGYGGGYYDKYLQRLEEELPSKNICKVAVAYECQMVENGSIENEIHDIKPDYIITEDRFICS